MELLDDFYTGSNVGKFVDDHEELRHDFHRNEILEKIALLSDERGVLTGANIREILGEHAELFFEEVLKDPEHIQLGLMVLKAAKQGLFKK